MFDNEIFDVYSFKEIPLDEDCYIVDEVYIKGYEKYLNQIIKDQHPEPIGYVSYVAFKNRNESSIELSWYPNISDRFHEVTITLPQTEFVACVGCWRWSEKPRIFVKTEWLERLYRKSYSVFCMIDAIGVKKALENGDLSGKKLIKLRDEIDIMSEKYPNISFFSFADSILFKGNWTVGSYNNDISYTYDPEIFLDAILEIQDIYKNTLNLEIYAILTQGNNEYYEDDNLHISELGNHISLNSLGVPFADLMSIDESVRHAIRNNMHKPSELYMEEKLYHSLNLKYEFQKNDKPKHPYLSKMVSGTCYYYPNSIKEISNNFEV